jgi:hypothetical protein
MSKPQPPFVFTMFPIPKSAHAMAAKKVDCNCVVCHLPIKLMAMIVFVIADDEREAFAVCADCVDKPEETILAEALNELGYHPTRLTASPISPPLVGRALFCPKNLLFGARLIWKFAVLSMG